MSDTVPTSLGHGSDHRICFVDRAANGDVVLMAFPDPSPCFAVRADASLSPAQEQALAPRGETLRVVVLPRSAAAPAFEPDPGSADSPLSTTDRETPAALRIKSGVIDLTWQPHSATLHCDPEQAEALLHSVVEFTHYERELRKLEREIANTWPELEQDKALAFQVDREALARSATIGQRMDGVLQRRIRHARIEPHLRTPDARLPAHARKLGEALRAKAQTESRLETVDGQLEVFEDIYEMGSQRLGEFRASSQEHILEWVIIVLLAAEALLMLIQTLLHIRS